MDIIDIDLTGSKILVVDDVPANLDVLCSSLEDTGYDVMVATDGQTALEVADFAQPHLILLDVMMPGIDGYETCRRLKGSDQTRGIPVIFLTARDEVEGIVEGFQSGGIDYVTKPFKKEELLSRIRTHLTLSRLARDLAELNAHLEQKVAERTWELGLKVAELEGKDRIAQHLLTYHSLEETLELVLEIVGQVLGLDRAVVYLAAAGGFRPAAATGVCAAGEKLDSEQLEGFSPTPTHLRAFTEISARRVPVNVTAPADGSLPPFALVPVLRGGDLLGIIEAAVANGGRQVSEAELETLSSFALQAAVAISDAQVRQDPGAWDDQLDEVLEIGGELEDAEAFEDLTRRLDEVGSDDPEGR